MFNFTHITKNLNYTINFLPTRIATHTDQKVLLYTMLVRIWGNKYSSILFVRA